MTIGRQLIIISIIFFSNYLLHAQSVPDSTKIKIDKLFAKWDTKDSPGCAIGIVRNDSLIYAKGYGMANLEYGIPNSPSTIYHIASVSKQFTAYCIVLLARQGKLNLNDDVKKYLSWFPDFNEKITIENLLNHTSGIRDQWQLLAISGTRLDDVITQEQIIKILSKQEALNFKPNEKATYSNSGYTMLAEIIKSVSGQSLREFADSAIFKPLKMTNTHFHDDYTEIVKNRAYSYSRKDSVTFSNSILSYSTVGATSLFTNIIDMSKWDNNFYNPKVGDKKDIDVLTGSKAKLNSGQQLDYAYGIVGGNYRGHTTYAHSGGDAGFRTLNVVIPDSKMGFILFSNLDEFSPDENLYPIIDLFTPDISPKVENKKTEKIDSSKSVLKSPKLYTKFSGSYIDEEGIEFSFSISNKKIYWHSYGRTYLMKADKDTIFLLKNPTIKFIFSINNDNDTLLTQLWPQNKRVLHKYQTIKSTDEQLQAYVGRYYSKELDCSYNIVLKNHDLLLTNSKYSDSKIEVKGANHLLNDTWWMNHLQIIRNSKNNIEGFEVNSDRVQHLIFTKIE
jgi:CubicO group peptidase (beta-lactamase class C family)